MNKDEVCAMWLEFAVVFTVDGNERWAKYCKQQAEKYI